MNNKESAVEKKNRLNRERVQRWRARQSQENLDSIRIINARAHLQQRASETRAQTQARRRADAEAHRQRVIEQHQQIGNGSVVYNGEIILIHDCGNLNIICQFCGSKNFIGERPSDGKFTSCCRKGKVKLPKIMDVHGVEQVYPGFLRRLLSDTNSPRHRHFKENIRSYNSAVSFASMGAKIIDLPGRGPYVFKVHGQTYHRTSHTLPVEQDAPQFAQLYVLDTTQATDIRHNHPANEQCCPRILRQIDSFFRQNNRIAESYRLMREMEAEAVQQALIAGDEVPVVNMVFRRDRQSDQRRYNAPSSNEVAMVFVNDDGEPPFQRDIRIYPRNPVDPSKPFVNISILSANLDPMTYAILFPFGEPGWQPNWRCESYDGVQQNHIRKNVSLLQYKAAQTAIRSVFNPIMSSGKLTQQWVVDSYLQVEANNLNFIRQNQQALRSENYQGLADHVENLAQQANLPAGVSVVLPSTFEGSPRNMRERCNDAMSIFSKYGAPDLFVTVTANPHWKEIKSNLKAGENVCDRPDLVARVFKIKLKSIMNDITHQGVFGQATAYVYSIEFQKRGLPHAHILVTLRDEDKFITPEQIDKFVSAEIPDPTVNPLLHEIVKKCMMHGPCGISNPNAPCMESGECIKKFPKSFTPNTVPNSNGYPLYRRRIDITTLVRGVTMDNRYVIPYSPFLLLKYDAHINVEICTSLRAVKYIYKYIFKGFDCANIAISSVGQQELRINEISNFIDARYVSAPEAMWRLLESPTHDRSHTVMRLPVHLPNQQRIYFEAGQEQDALLAAASGRTKLESYFQLNNEDLNARQLLYVEIPLHFVYGRGKWNNRQRGGTKTVVRMYTVSVKDEERFYLRLLLLHVRGATCFEFLRTVEGVLHPTFKAAAAQRGLLDSDEEWDRCLSEAIVFQMPRQLRNTFAYICCFCQPTNPSDLWTKYSVDMSLDHIRTMSDDAAINLALHDINSILQQHGLSCAMIGLPSPTGNVPDVQQFDALHEAQEAELRIGMLNEKQTDAFGKIINAIDNEDVQDRCFYLDGPGGSGKTFLYTTMMSFIRGRGQIVLPFATTGIAGTLLNGGRTVHSGFKLPVPLLENSVSSMRLNSPEATVLRQASLIIIDEITMLPKHGLRCIEKLLREIMDNEKQFGGKVFVIGGDFRQTLPIVPRGSRTDVIECCIKSSRLWSKFKKLTLTTNMRSEGQNDHNDWLLRIGTGINPSIQGINSDDTIEIPAEMIATEDLIVLIFGMQIENMSVEELAKRVIVAPTNEQTLQMNRQIIDLLPGHPEIYYSADSLISEDPSDTQNFPIEFLNEQTPSGMPPHVLLLKIGVIIMLLRNLDPKRGMCNGTRLIVRSLQRNFITAEIISQCNRGDIVFIPRIDLAPSDTLLPFILKRRQFPIIPAYAMTINKAQGQTFEHVGIHLNKSVFSHGQLYVALSRSRNPSQVKVMVTPNAQQGQLLNNERVFTKNVVFNEIFQM